MSNFKVVLLKHDYPSTEIEQRIIGEAGGEMIDTSSLSEADAFRACEQADAILVRWHRITAEHIRTLHRCKIIVRYGVGYDNVDLAAATEANILVGHVPHYCVDEVSTHAIALLLACVRRIAHRHRQITHGSWELNPTEPLFRTARRTLGLVGFGHIGQAVARKLGGWGLRLLATDPYVPSVRAEALGVRLVPLPELLRESDYVSLHVPLLPETHHLMAAEQFALLKPGAILVNTARGPVVDQAALLTALERDPLAQAALDVLEQEPPPLDSPLRSHPRVLVSDHIAWYSEEAQEELKITAAEEVVRVCTGGLPLAIANPDVLRRLGRVSEWKPNDSARWQLQRLANLGKAR